ncbi:hypothetical protein EBM89_06260 [Cellulomonas triticagri]|uniref:SIR2-like domain-containing protein n=2 Tax=Cellulomonas triticagri TaxID=2483352 RepID=A0A3M2JN35_9CELL|nr:hypothetical protein EBM89_06260 [Cellulomonas triticagri]
MSGHMPLTDELGARLVHLDEQTFGSVRGSSFETWLSHRAEPQPYLTATENLGRQAVFSRATSLIAGELDESIARALAEPMPTWLGELVSVWHLRRSHVVTFNYDTLVECVLPTMEFCDWRTGSQFAWGSLLAFNPGGPAGSSYNEVQGSAAPVDTFRLWKLHGSTNWFWVPGDTSGASARRVMLPGAFRSPRPVDAEEYHWMAPGRERLLVPPSALKSPYYANPVTRETWSSGFRALRSADIVTLIGYSLPATDLTTAGMLGEALHGGVVREVRIVDICPEAVVERVRDLAPANVDVHAVSAVDPVASYAAELLADAARLLVAELRATSDDDASLLLVSWGDLARQGRSAPIVHLEQSDEGRSVHLHAGEMTTLQGAVGAPQFSSEPISLSTLRAAITNAERLTVSVAASDGRSTLIAAQPHHASTGYGDGRWWVLVPAGAAPAPVEHA